MSDGWFREHLRPRDAFIAFSTLLLAALGLAVWTLGEARDDAFRERALTGIVTVISTLGGYYLGNRDRERAVERGDLEATRAARLMEELTRARGVVDRLEDELAQAADTARGLMDDAGPQGGLRPR